VWPYVTAVACFLPLLLRRRSPGLALVLTSVLTGFYLAMPWPPAIVVLAPMSALFTVSERYGGRRAVPIGIVLGAIVLGVSAMTVSVSYTVAQIVAILALLGLSAALGHGARTRRLLIEEVRQKREEGQLRRVEEERLRIARDVHDIMAHSLTLMTLQADAGLTTATDTGKSRAAFTIIGDTGRATLRDLRSMLSVLAGDTGDDSPREPVPDLGQLERLVRSVRETGLEVALDVDTDLTAVPSAVSVSAYRIAQEALTNVVRHAHARHADVVVHTDANELTLRVTDDGAGGTPAPDGGGRGLLGMAERVEVLGGTISAGPAADGGFEVRAAIPLTRSAR
jgi:signal transduction histidine kinase